ncbi:splicing factor, arginine/serine-rich 19-like [Pollicipes pollicipes]|uniref:splicing factor, arginine/serine-rich 19-like n=1 Tax=Pollicipes pollicipes TaxID=41117 RepID=UPI0018852F6B|nr:splicing factor, arginine/serine-rich 19-like [Pollicipes pollicipes]
MKSNSNWDAAAAPLEPNSATTARRQHPPMSAGGGGTRLLRYASSEPDRPDCESEPEQHSSVSERHGSGESDSCGRAGGDADLEGRSSPEACGGDSPAADDRRRRDSPPPTGARLPPDGHEFPPNFSESPLGGTTTAATPPPSDDPDLLLQPPSGFSDGSAASEDQEAAANPGPGPETRGRYQRSESLNAVSDDSRQIVTAGAAVARRADDRQRQSVDDLLKATAGVRASALAKGSRGKVSVKDKIALFSSQSVEQLAPPHPKLHKHKSLDYDLELRSASGSQARSKSDLRLPVKETGKNSVGENASRRKNISEPRGSRFGSMVNMHLAERKAHDTPRTSDVRLTSNKDRANDERKARVDRRSSDEKGPEELRVKSPPLDTSSHVDGSQDLPTPHSESLSGLSGQSSPREASPGPLSERSQSLFDLMHPEKRHSFAGLHERGYSYSSHACDLSRKVSLNSISEERRRSLSRLRGLVIPDKVDGFMKKGPVDLPTIKSKNLSGLSSSSFRASTTSCSSPRIKQPIASRPERTDSRRLTSPPWKGESPNIQKYSPAFKRKNISVHSSHGASASAFHLVSCSSKMGGSSVELSRPSRRDQAAPAERRACSSPRRKASDDVVADLRDRLEPADADLDGSTLTLVDEPEAELELAARDRAGSVDYDHRASTSTLHDSPVKDLDVEEELLRAADAHRAERKSSDALEEPQSGRKSSGPLGRRVSDFALQANRPEGKSSDSAPEVKRPERQDSDFVMESRPAERRSSDPARGAQRLERKSSDSARDAQRLERKSGDPAQELHQTERKGIDSILEPRSAERKDSDSSPEARLPVCNDPAPRAAPSGGERLAKASGSPPRILDDGAWRKHGVAGGRRGPAQSCGETRDLAKLRQVTKASVKSLKQKWQQLSDVSDTTPTGLSPRTSPSRSDPAGDPPTSPSPSPSPSPSSGSRDGLDSGWPTIEKERAGFDRKLSTPSYSTAELKLRERKDSVPTRPHSWVESEREARGFELGGYLERGSATSSQENIMDALDGTKSPSGSTSSLLEMLTANLKQTARSRHVLSVSDLRRAFERWDGRPHGAPASSGHARMSSLDSTFSEDGPGLLLSGGGSMASPTSTRDHYGSITSLASSTSLISPHELQQLIEEANQSLEEAGTPSHEIIVAVVHREMMGGSIGVTLAGGADYENKEISVNKVITGSVADRDGRIKKGDRVISINGRSSKGMSHREALNTLKAPRSEVVLVLSRSRSVTPHDPTSDEGGYQRPSISSISSRPPKILESPMDNKSLASELEAEDGSRGPPIVITLQKEGAGLGFSLQGGRDSPLGDRPLVAKKIFTGGAADKSGLLQVRDQILAINDQDITHMARIEAWTLLKKQPDGLVRLTIRKWLTPGQSPAGGAPSAPVSVV